MPADATASRVIGRYALYDALAVGGMATVHIGRLLGPVGFARTVAIKRLHPQFARNPEFVSMFLDEARMCARIRHPSVVPTLDIAAIQGELFLVMEYVQGESLANLLKAARAMGQKVPWRVAITIASAALHGLHAAHEARDERGMPMDLVHRDVSPQNILVGIDGMARVVDFGIAKATGRIHTTRDRAIKGKLGYMAYEQISGGEITRQADIYAAAVVLWETLTCQRLFEGDTEAIVLTKLLTEEVPPPSAFAPGVPKELDDLVLKGLSREAERRFATAREMAQALDRIGTCPNGVVGEWVESVASAALDERASKVAAVENGGGTLVPGTSSRESQPTVIPLEEKPSNATTRPLSNRALPVERTQRWLVPTAIAAAVLGAGGWSLLRGDPAVSDGTKAAPAAALATAPVAIPAGDEPPLVAPTAEGAPAPVPDVPKPAATAVATASPAKLSGRSPIATATPPPPPTTEASAPKPASPWSLGGRQ